MNRIFIKLFVLNVFYITCFISWSDVTLKQLLIITLFFNSYMVLRLKKLNAYSQKLEANSELFTYISKWNMSRKNKIRDKLTIKEGEMFSLEKHSILKCIEEGRDFKMISKFANFEIGLRQELVSFCTEKINYSILLAIIIQTTSLLLNLVIKINPLVNLIFIISILVSLSLSMRFLSKQEKHLFRDSLYKQMLFSDADNFNEVQLTKEVNKLNMPYVNNLYLATIKHQDKMITNEDLETIKEESIKDYKEYINKLLLKVKNRLSAKTRKLSYLLIIYLIGYFVELSIFMDVIING
ncbi:TPA: hypothetical protein GXZ34_04160 [bacterium]|nr:hypothetical protein [bacterium]